MEAQSLRITDSSHSPTPRQVEEWIGKSPWRYWATITNYIEETYPGIFEPEWLYGGKKYGWSLRYKKSRSFCTLIPEQNRCSIQIVFGAKEREKVEKVRAQLSDPTREAYDQAQTYHDGKWLFLDIGSETTLQDVKLLLTIKRKPKK